MRPILRDFWHWPDARISCKLGEGRRSLEMKELVYPRLLLPSAERFADKVGFIDATRSGVHYSGTFATHVERVLRLTHAMRKQLGISREDRYAVLAMNGHEFIELYHAALFGGGIINPLNIRFSAAELAYVLNDSGANIVFTDPMFAGLVEKAREEEGAKVDTIVMIGGEPGGEGGSDSLDISYEDLLASGEAIMPPEPEEDDPVILMYTGGTTGLPKGALLDQRAEVLNVYHVGLEIGLQEDRRFLFQSPMFHAAVVAGVVGIPASGATSVTVPMFDPELVMDTFETQQIDTTMVVPVMLAMLEQTPSFSPGRLSSLRQLVYGAAPISDKLLGRWLEMFPEVKFYQGYGMTEAASVLTFLGPEHHRSGTGMLNAAGVPVLGVELRITDSLGNEVGRGDTGEVCARGGNFMSYYWRKIEETDKVFREGWYRTGDVGYIDDSGILHLTDRMNDMIVTGGENVYSTEVENVLATHPAVEEVAVIGIPDDKWGEIVHAIVVLKANGKATSEQLIDHARERLASFKVPKSVEFHCEPLPLSGAFKPLKRELRKRYWENRDRQIG
jgi:long-chain acyl-CoA synthetase